MFDDAYKDIYTNAYPILKANGQKGVVAVNSNKQETNGYMLWNDLRELKNNNWELISHTADHSHMLELTSEQRIMQYEESKADILANTGVNAKFLIFPYNQFNQSLINECKNYFTNCGG